MARSTAFATEGTSPACRERLSRHAADLLGAKGSDSASSPATGPDSPPRSARIARSADPLELLARALIPVIPAPFQVERARLGDAPRHAQAALIQLAELP